MELIGVYPVYGLGNDLDKYVEEIEKEALKTMTKYKAFVYVGHSPTNLKGERWQLQFDIYDNENSIADKNKTVHSGKIMLEGQRKREIENFIHKTKCLVSIPEIGLMKQNDVLDIIQKANLLRYV